jgi:hypothetical protein
MKRYGHAVAKLHIGGKIQIDYSCDKSDMLTVIQ